MEAKTHGTEWRSILLLIFSLGGMAILILTAIGTLVMMMVNESVLSEFQSASNASPLAIGLTASAMVAMGLLLAPVAWLSLQRLRGREAQQLTFYTLRPRAWIGLPVLWILAITLATLFNDARGAGWFVPFLHFLSVGLPIYIIVRIGTNRITLGSLQRVWGVFGSGLALSTTLAVIVETMLFVVGIIILVVYMGMDNQRLFEIQRLASQLENAPSLESIVYLLEPILRNPLTLFTALTFLSFLVPIIEESTKSLGIWLVADQLASPAQGFAMGVLSGAGFAFAESLFASITPDKTWALTLSMRALSSSMHIMATGLIGMGIAYARLQKRYLRLFGLTILGMLLHGVWNGCAVLAVSGGIRVLLSMPEFDPLGALMMAGGFMLLGVLVIGMFIAFFVLNYNFRDSSGQLPATIEPTAVG